MANLIPNKIFKGTNSDGSKFTVTEWDFADIATIDIFNFCIMLGFGCLVSAFVPLLLTAMAIYYYNGRAKIFYVMTILISSYFIYDANHGWLVTMVLEFFFEQSSMNVLISATTACLVLNLVFLFVGGILYDTIEKASAEVNTRWVGFLGVVAFVLMVSYSVTYGHYKAKGNWVRHNIEEQVKRP